MSPQDRRDIGILIGLFSLLTHPLKTPFSLTQTATDDPLQLPKLYFDASIDALHRGNFLGKHSIYAVQAIVVLVGCCQDVGCVPLVSVLASREII